MNLMGKSDGQCCERGCFFFSSRGNEMPLRFLIGKKNKGVSDKKINNNNK